MATIGTVDSLWRYPVKGMRGEPMTEAFLGFAGIQGDRHYAIVDSAARKGLPYLTGRVHPRLILCAPRYRHPNRTVRPPNLTEASGLAPGANPANPDPDDMALDVALPSGDLIPIDDPALLTALREALPEDHQLKVVRSDRAMTDCRPLSLFGLATATTLSGELGMVVDHRRFRANVYCRLEGGGFAEDGLVGRQLRIGAKVVVQVLERDPRCKMISLDPDTGTHQPEVLRQVAQGHGGFAGVYAAVLVEGILAPGDPIALID